MSDMSIRGASEIVISRSDIFEPKGPHQAFRIEDWIARAEKNGMVIVKSETDRNGGIRVFAERLDLAAGRDDPGTTVGSGMTGHHAENVVHGHVSQDDTRRFRTLMSGGMTGAEVEEARAIYDASGQWDKKADTFFREHRGLPSGTVVLSGEALAGALAGDAAARSAPTHANAVAASIRARRGPRPEAGQGHDKMAAIERSMRSGGVMYADQLPIERAAVQELDFDAAGAAYYGPERWAEMEQHAAEEERLRDLYAESDARSGPAPGLAERLWSGTAEERVADPDDYVGEPTRDRDHSGRAHGAPPEPLDLSPLGDARDQLMMELDQEESLARSVVGPNPLLRHRAEAARLRDSSLQAAGHAGEACALGQAPAAGRAERDRRRTSTLDLKDHWNRAIKAETASAALAELAHAATAAKEAHGSDDYEQRAVRMVEDGAKLHVVGTDLARTLESALAARGYFEVHFPDGTMRNMTRSELHDNLRRDDPAMHAKVKYRWIETDGTPPQSTAGGTKSTLETTFALAGIVHRLSPDGKLAIALLSPDVERRREVVRLGMALGLLRKEGASVRLTSHGKGIAWDMGSKTDRSVDQIASLIRSM